jgi:hypothetical protein
MKTLMNLIEALLGMNVVTSVAILVAPYIEELRKEGR